MSEHNEFHTFTPLNERQLDLMNVLVNLTLTKLHSLVQSALFVFKVNKHCIFLGLPVYHYITIKLYILTY